MNVQGYNKVMNISPLKSIPIDQWNKALKKNIIFYKNEILGIAQVHRKYTRSTPSNNQELEMDASKLWKLAQVQSMESYRAECYQTFSLFRKNLALQQLNMIPRFI